MKSLRGQITHPRSTQMLSRAITTDKLPETRVGPTPSKEPKFPSHGLGRFSEDFCRPSKTPRLFKSGPVATIRSNQLMGRSAGCLIIWFSKCSQVRQVPRHGPLALDRSTRIFCEIEKRRDRSVR